MLPTNMMSFMKKMVTQTEQSSNAGSVTPDDGGTTFSKLRQLGSGLMNATGNVTKLSPAKITPVEDIQPKEEILVIEPPKPKPEPGKPASREGACRICLKSFKPEDFSRTCNECHYKVCEDCGYSTKPDSDDPSTWCCSVCKRKMSKGQPLLNDDSTESHLDIPSQPMRRRHSDVKLDSQNDVQMCGLGRGLAPPKNSDAGRRHSDVSPATLKELEKFRKVAGERRGTEELGWEWRSKSRGGSPDRHQSDRTERSDRNERGERKERGRTSSPQRKNSAVPDPDVQLDLDDEEERRRRARRGGGTVRRKSRVTRQHSYDDEIKSSGSMGSAGGGGGGSSHGGETGLGVTYQITRRSSAYDVYSATGSGGGGLNAMAIAAAQQQMQCSRDADSMYTKRSSISAQGAREPEEVRPSGRRPSFRAVIPVMPYEMPGDEEKMINLDANSSPDVIPPTQPQRRRGSQLPDISALRGLTSSPGSVKATPPAVTRVAVQDDRELPRQGSLVDGEGIKIVIHDVDSEMTSRVNPKRRVVLRRDPQLLDKGHRTRGFGMRVVGGKKSLDGRMYAAIVCTVPGGPAEKAGLQKGDKILEWSGVPLIDRSFEDVAHIIEHTGDVAELVVEHATDIIDLFDDPGMPNAGKNSGNMGLQLESETEKTPSSSKGRRTLPKTPEQMTKQVSGRVQIQVWYEADRRELVVSLLAADELCTRDDTGLPPQAFAKLVLLPPCGDQSTLQTDVSKSTQNPIWNANLTFPGISGEDLLDRTIDVTLWDCLPDGDTTYLGECSVDLQNAFETDRAVWYRLEDPRGLRSGKSPFCSPRGSISTELAQRLLRRTEIRERSYSDDTPSDSGSPEPYYLHPDHAWQANSRRGSSQSEQLEIEPYELSKDYSRSLPGSRRSSFQSQGGTDSKRGSMGETDMSVAYYNRDRRRSSCTRQLRDHDEIMRSLKAAAAKGELGRTMSLSNDKRRGSRRGERKDSVGQSAVGFPERLYDRNSESDEDDKLSQQSTRDENGIEVKLGPGQVVPRGFKLTSGVNNGEVKLALFLSKGTLEVEVISARDICPGEREEPDTYVKTYLRDGERWLHKRKTRVVKHSRTPQYRQTLKYGSCDALGRNLLVMLWEKKQGFESNQGLGGAEVDLELLPLTKLTVGWYPLFPIHTLGTQNADSP
ncbi:regulating synaptic membrane exocytosis protein 1 isoform X2 [Venturia canescens]|uniref:regulating synaptic membrane exocytosis protein 1 isoform X2 n=1 Tax=Venturia canescens TaxID=32260 RepID=UPI001C9CE5F1|nr:regulating synaptic membrane exocytosis protein 1 isoform X2 [Venturia canescens]